MTFLWAVAISVIAQSTPRACTAGVSVRATDVGPGKSTVSTIEATTFAELEALQHEVPVLTAKEAKRLPGAPELVVIQQIRRVAPDDVFFTIRVELRELGRVVWSGPPLSGLTSYGSEKDILSIRIVQAAKAALRECRASTSAPNAP